MSARAAASTLPRLAGRRTHAPLDPGVQVARRAWRWAVAAAVLGLLLALLMFAPARWLALAVQAGTDGRVMWPHARGSVWQGQADLLLTGGPGSRDAAALPQGLRWTLRPGWDGGPALHLELLAPCCMATPMALHWAPGWGRFQLRWDAHRSQWPAALLAGLGTPWNTLQFDGDIQVQSGGLTVRWTQGRATLQGEVTAEAREMSSRLSTLRPMGSYRLALSSPTNGADTQLNLTTLEGALRLSGQGQWVGGRLRFTGEAEARSDAEAALANLLNIIGRRSGSRSRIAIG